MPRLALWELYLVMWTNGGEGMILVVLRKTMEGVYVIKERERMEKFLERITQLQTPLWIDRYMSHIFAAI